MKKKQLKLLSITLSLFLLSTAIAGCTGSKKVSETNQSKSDKEITFPLKNPVTLTYWCSLVSQVSAMSTNLGDTELYKELEKRTGVKIQFKHPPVGQESEQFNLLIAANELPDIIEYDWLHFTGGPEAALNNNILISLNDYMDKYAENYKKIVSNDKELDRMVKTDAGKYYAFPFVRGTQKLTVYGGPIIRKDWLDDLNLKEPVTIDDWYNIIKAFKDNKKADASLSLIPAYLKDYRTFMGAYGVTKDYYIDDGKVKFGPIEPAYKEFLKTFAKWYKEGLLDHDFAVQNNAALDAKITSGRTGAFISAAGSGISRYTAAMKEKEPNIKFVGVPNPVLHAGERAQFGQMDLRYSSKGAAGVTTQSKNKELAVKFLDYAYGDEGHMLFNFGVEKVSYNMVDGYPKFTDLITNNPQKTSMSNILGKYVRANYHGPFVQDERYLEQYYTMPEQKEAIVKWADTDQAKHTLPPVTLTPDQVKKTSKIVNDINTYVDEMFFKFIMGSESLDKFDEYVENIKKMGVDEILEYNQEALARYLQR